MKTKIHELEKEIIRGRIAVIMLKPLQDFAKVEEITEVMFNYVRKMDGRK